LDLAKVETNSELSIGDETGSQLIEVTEELRDSEATLGADKSNASKNVFDITRLVPDDLGLADSWASLSEVVEAVVVLLTNSKESS
jgi:hypothetical protein